MCARNATSAAPASGDGVAARRTDRYRPLAPTQPEPRIEQRAAQPYVAIAVDAPFGEWSDVAALVTELLDWMRERGIPAAGAPFLRYWVAGDRDRPSRLEVGVPVPHAATEDDRVAAGGFIPAGRYAVLDHRDHPDRIGQSLQLLEAWGARRGVKWRMNPWDEGMEVWGGRFEFYQSDAADRRDPSRWRIEIAFLLREGTIRDDEASNSSL